MGTVLGNLTPPEGKNRFRAEVVRKIAGVGLHEFYDKWTGLGELFQPYPLESIGKEVELPLLRWQDGALVRVKSFLPMRWRKLDHWRRSICYYDLGQDRLVAVGYDSEGEAAYAVGIVADSAGLLKCPLRFELDGQRVCGSDIYAMPDGGVLIRYPSSGQHDFCELIRYAPGGSILWRKNVESEQARPFLFRDGLLWFRDREDQYYALDENGDEVCHLEFPPLLPEDERYVCGYEMLWDQPVADELWVERRQIKRRGRKRTYTLFRLDTRGRLLEQHPLPCDLTSLPGFGTKRVALWPGRICLASLDEGIWMLNAADLSVLAAVKACRGYCYVTFDGRGRVWVEVDGAWECYDQDLNLLSRHRLKGNTLQTAPQRRGDGALRILTYDEKENILRVYAMKEK